jgi:hypothetical protein
MGWFRLCWIQYTAIDFRVIQASTFIGLVNKLLPYALKIVRDIWEGLEVAFARRQKYREKRKLWEQEMLDPEDWLIQSEDHENYCIPSWVATREDGLCELLTAVYK